MSFTLSGQCFLDRPQIAKNAKGLFTRALIQWLLIVITPFAFVYTLLRNIEIIIQFAKPRKQDYHFTIYTVL